MDYCLLFVPIITAFIGWLLHLLVVLYIRKKYWPQKQTALVNTIANWAGSHFSVTGFTEKITDPHLLDTAMPAIEKHIDAFLNEKLQQEIPMLSMFVGTKTTDKIKDIFIGQLKQLFPTVMLQITDNLQPHLDINKKIKEQLQQLETQKAILKILQNQLKFLPLLGLVSGFIIGLIIAVLFYFWQPLTML